MRANVFLYKPEEKCVKLTVILKKLDKVKVEVLHLILGKLNKNKKTMSIIFKTTPLTSAMFSSSTTLLIAEKWKHENNPALLFGTKLLFHERM